MPSAAAPTGARPDPGAAGALRARIAALVAAAPGSHRQLHCGDDWLYLHDPDMPALPHGWKLHVSARPDRFPHLLDVVVPILLRRTCDAKFAAGTAVLRELNTGLRDPAAVGKAVTVYPCPGEEAALADELANALTGWTGPRVPSDRQLRADAPVYYRYGLFRVAAEDSTLLMTGPAGETFPAPAAPHYRQPPWVSDPFAPRTAPRPTSNRIGDGGRYRITAGITRAPGGHVYRAVDVVTGREVVVKQARAFVAEDAAGIDARGRLRHERRVLTALAGVGGVPRLVDYVRHGEDEYLVSSACGRRDLRRDVLEGGPYEARAAGPGGAHGPGRDWWSLARGLLRALDAVHARGVVMCDLKPANVVLDAAGGCALVDFGISALDGERPAGTTRGYGLPCPATTTAHPTDDYYALGTTLHYAATGLDPVVIDPDRATNRDRTLACLAGALPDPQHPAVALVAGLLGFDPAERAAAADALRHHAAPPGTGLAGTVGERSDRARRVPAPPRPPRVTAELLGEVVDHTVTTCVRLAGELVTADARSREPRALLSFYDGSAGLGLELLQHADRPDARAAATALARWTAAHPAIDRLGPGLYEGRTGVDLFLARAADVLGTEEPLAAGPGPGDVRSTDQISGAAGLGTGRLLLAGRARAAGREAEAEQHLATARACARLLTDGRADGPRETPNPGTAALEEGFAHGRAGVAHFLLGLSAASATAATTATPAGRVGLARSAHSAYRAEDTEAAAAAARRLVDALAEDVPRLVVAAGRPGATRRYGSWCRGLAGIGTTLVQAGRYYGADEFLTRAADAARACRESAPRTAPVVQCCGLAGAGELLIDLALATGDERHWEAAEEIAGLVLARSGGRAGRPVFPATDPTVESAAWAVGTSGVLSFLRRLHRRGGPRLGMLLQP
ncbi:class IV lanthionine synthetase LanL [Kitasatospora sp. NPDC086009]|uniref:class IV lanthionine synthetase LanL n=1 Tax=unclassified Kitasatospora TaxID=2633591 RepID=UPI0037C74B38